MKSTTGTNTKPKYPYLGEVRNSSHYIVLFTAPSTGTIIHLFGDTDEIHSELGYTADNWAEENFTPYTGQVVLSN